MSIYGGLDWWVTFRNKKPRRKDSFTETLEFKKRWQRDVFVDGLNANPDKFDRIRINESL